MDFPASASWKALSRSIFVCEGTTYVRYDCSTMSGLASLSFLDGLTGLAGLSPWTVPSALGMLMASAIILYVCIFSVNHVAYTP